MTPAFSATAIAASSAAVSTSGLRGRKEDVKKLNMSRGERTLEKKSTNIKRAEERNYEREATRQKLWGLTHKMAQS